MFMNLSTVYCVTAPLHPRTVILATVPYIYIKIQDYVFISDLPHLLGKMQSWHMDEASTMPRTCFLELNDPRLAKILPRTFQVNYDLHAGTLTITTYNPTEQVIEKIRLAFHDDKKISAMREGIANYKSLQCYMLSSICYGFGMKNRYENETKRPKIQPPWVTNPGRFGTWRPSPLRYEDYYLMEVIINEEKCFIHWRNLYQACRIYKLFPCLLDYFTMYRSNGTRQTLALSTVKKSEEALRGRSRWSFGVCQVNPPGVALDPADFYEGVKQATDAYAAEREFMLTTEAIEYRKDHRDKDMPLDDDGYPLIKGSINGVEVYVERETYWKECYLSLCIDGLDLVLGLQRTDGRKEELRIFIANGQLLDAFHHMIEAWRELWPGEVPGLVRDISADWAVRRPKDPKEHWFNETYGFGERWIGGAEKGKGSETLMDGTVETMAHIAVREVSDGFGLRLSYCDGSEEVIHFDTADLMHGRTEISEVVNTWRSSFPGGTMVNIHTPPVSTNWCSIA